VGERKRFTASSSLRRMEEGGGEDLERRVEAGLAKHVGVWVEPEFAQELVHGAFR
jgi:hypothetical protein